MRYISLLLFLTFSVAINAQTTIIHRLQANEAGKGKVTIYQDESITALIGGGKRLASSSASNSSSVKGNTISRDEKKSSKPVVELNDDEDEEIVSAAKHKAAAKKEESFTSPVDVSLDGVVEQAPRKIIKVAGYRVQVYAGNNTRTAKLEAMRTASDVRNFFPEVSVYSFFSPPRWLCRVGDFRSMEEAYSMMRKLKATRVFHEVSIVKDRVNVSL